MAQQHLPRRAKQLLGFLHGAADRCHAAKLLHEAQKGPLLRAEHALGCLDLQGNELGDPLTCGRRSGGWAVGSRVRWL